MQKNSWPVYYRTESSLLLSHVSLAFTIHAFEHSCVIGESSELTQDAKETIARMLYPTLLQLVSEYDEDEPFPAHYLAYGVHLSRTHLSILAHFPTWVDSHDGTMHVEFHQVVLAQHMISVELDGCMSDELFLARWRAMIALLTVKRHTGILAQDIDPISVQDEVVYTRYRTRRRRRARGTIV